MAARKIYVDLTNQKLVASANGTNPKPMESPFHQDKLYLSIQPLEINPTSEDQNAPYTALDGSGYSLTILIVLDSDKSTLAGPVSSWTPDGNAKLGSIDMFTTPMQNAFTSPSTESVPAIIEFQFTDAANVKTTIQQDLVIKRAYIVSGTPVAVPGVRYLTSADESRYVKYDGNPDGATITLNKGGAERVIGVGTGGEGQDDSGS